MDNAKKYVFKFLAVIEEFEPQNNGDVTKPPEYVPSEADQKTVVVTVDFYAYSFEDAEKYMKNSLSQALDRRLR